MAKVITGKCRLAYVNIANPKSDYGDEPKYGLCALIPKSDKATIKKIKDAIEEAREEGKSSKWNGKIPPNLKLPLRDGDTEKDIEEQPEFKGMYFLNAYSKRKPGVVDRDREEIFDLSEVYSGCWGRLSLNFYPYEISGNKGVAVGLNNIQKLKDGERLGGGSTKAEDDFDDDYEDDDLL